MLNVFCYTRRLHAGSARRRRVPGHVDRQFRRARSPRRARTSARNPRTRRRACGVARSRRLRRRCANSATPRARFDLIVLDPPKFAPTAAHAERASRAYKDINLWALKLLRPGGLLATFSCSRGIDAELFRKIVAGAALDAGADATVVGRFGAECRPSGRARVSGRRIPQGPADPQGRVRTGPAGVPYPARSSDAGASRRRSGRLPDQPQRTFHEGSHRSHRCRSAHAVRQHRRVRCRFHLSSAGRRKEAGRCGQGQLHQEVRQGHSAAAEKTCTDQAAEKKLAGAAKNSFVKKCVTDATAAAPAAAAPAKAAAPAAAAGSGSSSTGGSARSAEEVDEQEVGRCRSTRCRRDARPRDVPVAADMPEGRKTRPQPVARCGLVSLGRVDRRSPDRVSNSAQNPPSRLSLRQPPRRPQRFRGDRRTHCRNFGSCTAASVRAGRWRRPRLHVNILFFLRKYSRSPAVPQLNRQAQSGCRCRIAPGGRLADRRHPNPGNHGARAALASAARVSGFGAAPRTTTYDARQAIHRVLHGADDRLLVVVGPCSIHDYDAAIDYATRLAAVRRELADRSDRRDARLFRKAAHDRRLEGPHQRSAARRQLPHQRGPAPRAAHPARDQRARAARRHRVPRHDHAAVHRRPDRVGRHRRAHHGEPGAPRARVGTLLPGRASRTAPTATSASRSTRSRPRRRRTISCR